MDQLLNHLLILSLFLMRMTTGDNLTSTGNQMLQDLLAKNTLFKESQFQPVLPLKDHAKKNHKLSHQTMLSLYQTGEIPTSTGNQLMHHLLEKNSLFSLNLAQSLLAHHLSASPELQLCLSAATKQRNTLWTISFQTLVSIKRLFLMLKTYLMLKRNLELGTFKNKAKISREITSFQTLESIKILLIHSLVKLSLLILLITSGLFHQRNETEK